MASYDLNLFRELIIYALIEQHIARQKEMGIYPDDLDLGLNSSQPMS